MPHRGDGPQDRPQDRRRGGPEDRPRGEDAANGESDEIIEVAIEALAAGGDGVGRDRTGRVTFVPHTAPGDRVTARVVAGKKRHAHAEPIAVLQPSPGRVEPVCALFADRRCGGCQWQHVAREDQLAAKQALCARELRGPIAAGMELLPIVAEVPPYHGRRRVRLHWVRPRGQDRVSIGFFAPRSHRVVDVEACPQMTRALADAVAVIRAELTPHLGSRGEISVIAGHEGHVHVAIDGYLSPRHAARLVGKGGLLGTIVGVVLSGGPAGAGGPGPPRRPARLEWGRRSIALEPGLRGRADHFAQASEAGNRALLDAVDRACGPRDGQRVVEFHAGGGNLTRILERGARALVVSDRRPLPRSGRPPGRRPVGPSGERARGRRELRVGMADAVARELAEDGYHFDLAVLDPPRTGDAALMAPLAALRPDRIVYVSCDPATLARDVDALTRAGYRAIFAQPLDLMPQTAHVEVVVRLDAAPAAGRQDPDHGEPK